MKSLTLRVLSFAAVPLIILTSCSSKEADLIEEEYPSNTTINEELSKLPSAEESLRVIDSTVLEIKRKISSLVPDISWMTRTSSEEECTGEPWSRSDGVRLPTSLYVGSIPIPDSLWPEVLTFARNQARSIGIDEITPLADRPHHHYVKLSGNGGLISLGTENGVIIDGLTSCRLPNRLMPDNHAG